MYATSDGIEQRVPFDGGEVFPLERRMKQAQAGRAARQEFANNHLVESEWVAPRDALLLSFMPHMHLRGKDFEYRAQYPDGRKETILSVPHYDFNWQTQYRLAEPLRLPKGTKIHCTAHFDNSAANPANPDAKIPVTWGEQTWEEMMIGWVDFVWEQPER